jgi:hypothetical protein
VSPKAHRPADLHPSRNRAWGPAAVQIRVIGSPLPMDVEDAAKALAESEPEVIIHLVPAGQMIEHAPLLLRYQYGSVRSRPLIEFAAMSSCKWLILVRVSGGVVSRWPGQYVAGVGWVRISAVITRGLS